MFRTRLRQLREDAGYKSQQAFADAFGVAQSTVGNWEAGKREPNYETTIRLAKFLHTNVDYLLGFTEQEEKPTPEDGGGPDDDEALDREFRHWFREQSPERQKEVLFDLAKAVSEHDE